MRKFNRTKNVVVFLTKILTVCVWLCEQLVKARSCSISMLFNCGDKLASTNKTQTQNAKRAATGTQAITWGKPLLSFMLKMFLSTCHFLSFFPISSSLCGDHPSVRGKFSVRRVQCKGAGSLQERERRETDELRKKKDCFYLTVKCALMQKQVCDWATENHIYSLWGL